MADVSNIMLTREQLELVVPKKKVNEVFEWFHEHFINSSAQEYATRCPYLIIQGPTGCGKSETLKWVARELKIPIKEYSETTETDHIKNCFMPKFDQHEDIRLLDKRRAAKFEFFVYNTTRFSPLEQKKEGPQLVSADSEFDSDDEMNLPNSLRPIRRPEPVALNIIIHVEATLTFSKSQKILMATLARLIKLFRDLSKINMRRVAIVFENLENEREVTPLPTKFKQAIKVQTIRFNPIIRTTMKKFIESKVRSFTNVTMDKDAIELLINDCDGDLRACSQTLQLLSNRIQKHNSYMRMIDCDIISSFNASREPKRQRLNLELSPSLLRDVTRSVGFFHILGKIFYQKRLYPERSHFHNKTYRHIDRPYPPENTTEYLASLMDINSKQLLPWLHQHYHHFLHDTSLEKAALFISHLSDIDTISISSIQSSQFYESHYVFDQNQLHLAIEATVYSLYQDQSKLTKSSQKKVATPRGSCVIKSSVETTGSGDLYAFSRPASLCMWKLMEDRKTLLGYCAEHMMESDIYRSDPNKMLVDYIPYLCKMSECCEMPMNTSELDAYKRESSQVMGNNEILNMIKLLGHLEEQPQLEFGTQQEQLKGIIEEIDALSNMRITGDLPDD